MYIDSWRYNLHIDYKLYGLLIFFSRKIKISHFLNFLNASTISLDVQTLSNFLKTNRLSLLDSPFSLLHFAEISPSLDQLPSRFALFADYLRLSEVQGSAEKKKKDEMSRCVDLIEFLLPWSMPTTLIRPEFPSQISIMKV